MSDKLKRFTLLFLYTVFVIFIYFLGERYLLYLRHMSRTQTFNSDSYMIAYALIPIVMGLIIALPSFVTELRKQGKWQIDWIKFIAVGIPALYLAIFRVILVISPQTQGGNLPLINALYSAPVSMYLMSNVSGVASVSGVIFGYILLISPYKVNSDESITVNSNAQRTG